MAEPRRESPWKHPAVLSAAIISAGLVLYKVIDAATERPYRFEKVHAVAATREQDVVQKALEKLGLERQVSEPGVMGGPVDFKVTDATISKLESLKGKTLFLDSDGSLNEK